MIFFQGMPEQGDEAKNGPFFEFFPNNGCLFGMEKAPQMKKIANNVDTDMAYRYRRAYELEFKKQSDDVQKKILAAKENPDKSHRQANDFIKTVILIAESEREL